jgi:hypothetical protein
MANREAMRHLTAVGPPATPVVRIARRPGDPFEPPAWTFARPDGTFGNRFDDPGQGEGRTVSARFRVVYCATRRAGAFGETVAHFRPPLHVLATETASIAKAIESARGDLVDPEYPRRGLIPVEWRLRRHLGTTVLDPALRFVDIAAADTMQGLREDLASTIVNLGLTDFDLSVVTGSQRRLTQACARFVYEQTDESARPCFAGIRYLSRLNPEWECWAIFSDRKRHQAVPPESVLPDDPELLEAAAILGSTIEDQDGQHLRPWLP